MVWNVDGGNFELTIRDDGRGFETATGRAGLGLRARRHARAGRRHRRTPAHRQPARRRHHDPGRGRNRAVEVNNTPLPADGAVMSPIRAPPLEPLENCDASAPCRRPPDPARRHPSRARERRREGRRRGRQRRGGPRAGALHLTRHRADGPVDAGARRRQRHPPHHRGVPRGARRGAHHARRPPAHPRRARGRRDRLHDQGHLVRRRARHAARAMAGEEVLSPQLAASMLTAAERRQRRRTSSCRTARRRSSR